MGIFKNLLKRMYNNTFALEIEVENNEKEGLKKEISNLNTAIERLKAKKQTDFPKSLGTINLVDNYALLKSICPEVYISDEVLNTTSVTEYQKFSEETAVQYRTWVKEQHDCDNFSFELMGYFSQGLMSYAFGIAWSNSHAFNICITNKNEIYIIEPQTNKYINLEEAKKDSKYYPLRMICM